MADQTSTTNPATQTDPTATGSDKSNPTSQSGQPNEMPDRGQSEGSKGDQFDRKPEATGDANAKTNEGDAPSSSTMQDKGMGEDEKGSAEPAPTEGASH